jgi:hypothetical protein
MRSHVIGIDLRGDEFQSDTIPTELAQLSRLQQLSFEGRRMAGSIPSELARLTLLNDINFVMPRLWGTSTSKFQKLNVSTNVSRVLRSVSLLQSSRIFFLSTSLFSVLPLSFRIVTFEIGRISTLQHFSIQGAGLVGIIPFTFENLTLLQTLVVSGTAIGGCLPSLNSSVLRWLDVSRNWLFCDAHSFDAVFERSALSLQYVDLSRNRFSGYPPPSLLRLARDNDELHCNLDDNLRLGCDALSAGTLCNQRLCERSLMTSTVVPRECTDIARQVSELTTEFCFFDFPTTENDRFNDDVLRQARNRSGAFAAVCFAEDERCHEHVCPSDAQSQQLNNGDGRCLFGECKNTTKRCDCYIGWTGDRCDRPLPTTAAMSLIARRRKAIKVRKIEDVF